MFICARALGVALIALTATTGCAAQPEAQPPHAVASPTSLASMPAATDADPTLTGATLSKEESAAVKVADAAMTAYAQPTLSANAWLTGLSRYLTAGAATSYEYTNPANIPVDQLTGTGAAQPGNDYIYTGLVAVPTNVGTYTVMLTRQDAAEVWQVNLITDPAGRS